MALRDGVARGPVLGGTIDGTIDYKRDKVDLRGTLVPLYGPNDMLGRFPVVGPILGGEKEGIFGLTYRWSAGRGPVLNINPISALAPGLLRKMFEFPATSDRPTTTAPIAATPTPLVNRNNGNHSEITIEWPRGACTKRSTGLAERAAIRRVRA